MIEARELISTSYDFNKFIEEDSYRDNYCEQYPLFHAYSCAYDTDSDTPLDIVNLLLPYSDIFAVNNQSQNLLHVAVFTGEVDIVKYAINNGVSINEVDAYGKTPREYDNTHTISALIHESIINVYYTHLMLPTNSALTS